MKKLRLSSKKTLKCSIVNYTKMLFRTKGLICNHTLRSRESFQPYPLWISSYNFHSPHYGVGKKCPLSVVAFLDFLRVENTFISSSWCFGGCHLFKTTFLVGEPWINRKCFWVAAFSSSFCFAFWKKGGLVLEGGVLAILVTGLFCLDVISFRLPSLREEWLVFVVLGFGVLDEKRLGVFSLFSVMLVDTPGFGRAAVL